MKILLCSGVKYQEKTYLSIAEDGKITYFVDDVEAGDFRVEAYQFKSWYAGQVYYSPIKGLVWGGSTTESRDTISALRQHAAINERPIFSVAWGETINDVVIVTWVPCDTSLPTTVSNTPGVMGRRLDQVLPGFSDNFTIRSQAKADLMIAANPMESLAALENQVDLLTKLVLALAKGDPVPEWFGHFARIAEENSSLKLVGPNKALDTIEETKKTIRTLQKRYFDRRDKKA